MCGRRFGKHLSKGWTTTRKKHHFLKHHIISHANSTRLIAGEFEWQVRGVYYNAMVGKFDCLTRLYIGQSRNLRIRIRQHTDFRHRRDNPSLHYYALQKSKNNAFGILCTLPSPNMGNHTLPGMDEPELLLNLLEMWMCLVFRCLPRQTLEQWLPTDVRKEANMSALNIQCPVDNWEGSSSRPERVDLRNAEDPLVREWEEMKRLEWEDVNTKTKEVIQEVEVQSFPMLPILLGLGIGSLVGFYLGRAKGR